MTKQLTLKHILPYFAKDIKTKIYQTDCYNNKQCEEEIFEGYLGDIPWIYLDYYLDNEATEFNEAIDCFSYNGNAILEFYIRKHKTRQNTEENFNF